MANLTGLLEKFSRDPLQDLIARGQGWHFDVGAFSTPIVGGGNGDVLDQDQPEFGISVPDGYALIPVRLHIQCQVPLLAADSNEQEILIALDKAAAYVIGGGTVTAETPTNMRTDVTTACPATCFSAATANITNPTLGVELARSVILGDVQGTAANGMWSPLSLLYEPKRPPIIVGPAAIYGYWGGTVAMSGFANLDFIVIGLP